MVFTPTLTNVIMTKAIREYDRYSKKRLQTAMAVRGCRHAQYYQAIAAMIVLAQYKPKCCMRNVTLKSHC